MMRLTNHSIIISIKHQLSTGLKVHTLCPCGFIHSEVVPLKLLKFNPLKVLKLKILFIEADQYMDRSVTGMCLRLEQIERRKREILLFSLLMYLTANFQGFDLFCVCFFRENSTMRT